MTLLTEEILTRTMDELRSQIDEALTYYENDDEQRHFSKAEVTFLPASLSPLDSICEQTAENENHDNHTWQNTAELISVATYTDYIIETKYCTECPAEQAVFHNMLLQLET